MGATFTKLTPTVRLDMIFWCYVVVGVLVLHFTLEWPWLEWNGEVNITVPTTYGMGDTFTKLAPTVHHDIICWCHIMAHDDLCPWPTFHAWVTMVRKKRISLYNSVYECYIHQTDTNCSSWHDLLMPRGGWCPWPTFHASMTKTQNGNSGAPSVCHLFLRHSTSVECLSAIALRSPSALANQNVPMELISQSRSEFSVNQFTPTNCMFIYTLRDKYAIAK